MKITGFGTATYRKGKLYFDQAGWSFVKLVAKRRHKSPKAVVIEAIKRYVKQNKVTK